MRVFNGLDNLPAFTNAVATMGSFDGVHCGHRVLLDRVKRLATELEGESIVLTFEPHPRYVLGTKSTRPSAPSMWASAAPPTASPRATRTGWS
ncbi:MAG: hypothetical protein IIX32_04955 [Alistipes sp.]|nr:hypothetical protein [Alistipes sp.]